MICQSESQVTVLQKMEVPKDRHNFVFVSVYFFGLAFIMPWQILVVMSGYWDQTFNQSDHKGFASHLTLASTIPYAISITLHALIGQKFSIRSRVYCSQVFSKKSHETKKFVKLKVDLQCKISQVFFAVFEF